MINGKEVMKSMADFGMINIMNTHARHCRIGKITPKYSARKEQAERIDALCEYDRAIKQIDHTKLQWWVNRVDA